MRAAQELRRHDVHLEGLLLADLLVEGGGGLHGRGHELDGLRDRQVRERLRGRSARLGRRALVRRDLPRGGRRRESFQPLDLQEQLRAVDRLALAAAEELLLEPGNLRSQGRDLFPQGGDFVRRGGGGGHAVS